MEREEFLRRYVDITNVMADEIREDLHSEIAPCTEIEFLKAYVEKDYDIINYILAEHREIAAMLS